jgi:hypothetical protein
LFPVENVLETCNGVKRIGGKDMVTSDRDVFDIKQKHTMKCDVRECFEACECCSLILYKICELGKVRTLIAYFVPRAINFSFAVTRSSIPILG